MENKLPITRLNRFFSQTDFDLHIQMGKEYLHGDINMRLVIYQVDKTKTGIDDIYAEVGEDEIKFFPPVEFNALVRVEEPKNNSYKEGIVRYIEPGNLIFSVYIDHLKELNVDVKYGDYIGYPDDEEKLRFYAVVNDGKVTSDNKHKMFGYKPHYRTIVCSIAQDTEFKGI
jgi:hypothetical protein